MLITMRHEMKQRYRVFRRSWGTYHCEDLVTKNQESLSTRDRNEAYRLAAAMNETADQPAFSRQLARVYWKAGDPDIPVVDLVQRGQIIERKAGAFRLLAAIDDHHHLAWTG